MFYRDRGYLGAKTKVYDSTMKRTVKENTLGMSYILRNKRINSKRSTWKLVYTVTKKKFKKGMDSIHGKKKNGNKLGNIYNMYGIRFPPTYHKLERLSINSETFEYWKQYLDKHLIFKNNPIQFISI